MTSNMTANTTVKPRTRVLYLAAALPGLLLAGCGDSQPQAAAPAAAPVVKGVFVSARDCTDSGQAPREACEAAIDRAVAAHVATAPSYPSQRACETAEGTNMCERTDAKTYRPRLIAFLVTFAKPVSAQPLYPHKTDPGFRTLGNKVTILVSDDGYTFSRTALSSADMYLKGG